MRIAVVVLVVALLGACRSSEIHYRHGFEAGTLAPVRDYRAIPVIEDLPAPGTFDQIADVAYRSTGLDPYSIAETWLQSRAGEAGADALYIRDRSAIKSVGYTASLDGIAIRYRDAESAAGTR